jgi:hypothetical protein
MTLRPHRILYHLARWTGGKLIATWNRSVDAAWKWWVS